jgi:hypothetical protein
MATYILRFFKDQPNGRQTRHGSTDIRANSDETAIQLAQSAEVKALTPADWLELTTATGRLVWRSRPDT